MMEKFLLGICICVVIFMAVASATHESAPVSARNGIPAKAAMAAQHVQTSIPYGNGIEGVHFLMRVDLCTSLMSRAIRSFNRVIKAARCDALWQEVDAMP